MTMTTSDTPQEVLKRPYTRNLKPDPSGGYVASIHEFPGCIAHGDTADEAMQNLERTAESWLEAALGTGYEVPPPSDYSDCSGKIALRISRRLHQLASERAQLEGTSLNQLLSTAIAEYLRSKTNEDLLLALESKLDEVAAQCKSFSSMTYRPVFVQLPAHHPGEAFSLDAWIDWASPTSRKIFFGSSSSGEGPFQSSAMRSLIRSDVIESKSHPSTTGHSSDGIVVMTSFRAPS
jgi:predicted RNase H-like HicB family nuclease